jgi:hypothetical protein
VLLGDWEARREAVDANGAYKDKPANPRVGAGSHRALDQIDVRRPIRGHVDAVAVAHGSSMHEGVESGQKGRLGDRILQNAHPLLRSALDRAHESQYTRTSGTKSTSEVRP